MTEQERDIYRDMAIGQGYVPKGCDCPGELIFALVNSNKDPCNECNHDRTKCGGREKGGNRMVSDGVRRKWEDYKEMAGAFPEANATFIDV